MAAIQQSKYGPLKVVIHIYDGITTDIEIYINNKKVASILMLSRFYPRQLAYIIKNKSKLKLKYIRRIENGRKNRTIDGTFVVSDTNSSIA